MYHVNHHSSTNLGDDENEMHMYHVNHHSSTNPGDDENDRDPKGGDEDANHNNDRRCDLIDRNEHINTPVE